MTKKHATINKSMTIDEISRIPTSRLRTYTKAEIIESLKTKVHEMYSPDKQK